MTVFSIDHIVATPGTCSGKPRINGTRMRVKDVVHYHLRADWPISEIIEQFDLTPGQIYAALSYYFDHKDEIDEDMRQDEEFAQLHAGEFEETKRRILERSKKR